MLTIEEHTELEESIADAFFPAWARRWLRRDHRRLERRRFPPAELRRHAKAELRLFRRFAPWTVETLERQHEILVDGAGDEN